MQNNNLFLAKFVLIETYVSGSISRLESKETIRLVWAEDEEQAEDKIRDEYEGTYQNGESVMVGTVYLEKALI